MKMIYVSGPYTLGDVAVNVRTAMDAGIHILDKGDAPFIPHLFHFLHLVHERKYERWLDVDLAVVERCDALLRLPGMSSGASAEVHIARDHGIPVYTSLEELYGD
jgi:hypothetical protein